MTYRAAFRCVNGCPGEHPLDVPLYECPGCGDLLEVTHDLEALAATPGAEWRRIFDTRASIRARRPSGVWSKKEWVCPLVRDECIVSMDEGGTSLIEAPQLARQAKVGEVWIKHCGHSHTGSFKDLGMTVLMSVVRQMIRDGAAVRAVACASTGDTSAALSAYAAATGVPAIVLLPKGKVSVAQLLQPLANGAHVLALDTDFDGCMALVQRLAREAGVYLANSMNSLRLEGQKTVALEIAQQLDWQVPDAIVIPGGNLGNVSALGAGLAMMERLGVVSKRPRLVVAQAQAANPLYRASLNEWRLEPVLATDTQASAIRIGNPVSFKKAVRTLRSYDGLVEHASESELAEASALADLGGFFTCPHTGVALAAFLKLAARGVFRPTDRVVIVSTANGLKFTEFKQGYHEGRLAAVTPERRNVPIELDASYDAVRRAVDRIVAAPAALA